MKINVKGLDATMLAIEKLIASKTTETLKGRAGKLVTALAAATPIDTGEAMRGWHTEVVNKKVTIVNDVPYIAILNQGHSKQAPLHFVETECLKHGKAIGALIKTTPG